MEPDDAKSHQRWSDIQKMIASGVGPFARHPNRASSQPLGPAASGELPSSSDAPPLERSSSQDSCSTSGEGAPNDMGIHLAAAIASLGAQSPADADGSQAAVGNVAAVAMGSKANAASTAPGTLQRTGRPPLTAEQLRHRERTCGLMMIMHNY